MTNLSTKELNYIKDFLTWELLMAKKCKQYADQETIPGFAGSFNQAGQLHQQNYMNLVTYLENINPNKGGMMQ
jgi:hypothetical protein